MKFALLAAVSTAALVLGSQTASAQPIVVQSGRSAPGVTFGATIVRPGGLTLGGYYSTAPSYYSEPIYAGPVLIPVRPVVPVVPVYGPGYGRPYLHHHHGYRW